MGIRLFSSDSLSKLADGTVSSPSLQFLNDPDTGLYRVGSGIVGIAVNGVDGLQVSTTSVRSVVIFRMPDGSATAPGIQFNSDNDCGLYRVGDDNIAIVTGGTISAQFSSTGAVSIKGSSTNDSAAAGYVGEYIESLVTSATSVGATSVWSDMTSITLSAGDWDVTGIFGFNPNGATVDQSSPQRAAVSINSGTTITDQSEGVNECGVALGSTDGIWREFTIPNYRISVSSSTTVYLKSRLAYSVAVPEYKCRLSARRVR